MNLDRGKNGRTSVLYEGISAAPDAFKAVRTVSYWAFAAWSWLRNNASEKTHGAVKNPIGKPLVNGSNPECPEGVAANCGIYATGSHLHAYAPAGRLESLAAYRLSMVSKSSMVNGMGIRAATGKRGIALLALGLGVLLSGCMQQTIEPASDANLTPRDRKLLANPPYAKATIPEPYQRHIVDFHRKESPGTIVIDPDARYLYYVLDNGKAIRYGVTVGEEALVFSGVAKVGRREEWPSWTPTADIKKRLGNIPDFVGPGPHNPLGARGLYLFSGNRDTLYRIHGTNQPEYIGSAISSGCIRMTNEDVIDLYNRVKLGTPVVVLALGQSDSPYNPRMALGSSGGVNN